MSRWTANSDYDYAEECGDPVGRQERSAKIDYSKLSIKKPEPRKRTKRRTDRLDATRLTAFRDQVWDREEGKFDYTQVTESYGVQWARCQHCGTAVSRSLTVLTGEVHHRIPRSRCTPEQRYDPNNGVLLCGHLLNDCHGKAQRHEISV